MQEHIRERATRQRPDFAISATDGAILGQAVVEKGLWWTRTTAPSSPSPGPKSRSPKPQLDC